MVSLLTSTDVVIIGGGLVGATLAQALRQLEFSVALIEKKFLPLSAQEEAFSSRLDRRALALNLGSLRIFKQLFDWDLSSMGALVKHIQVSDRGSWGRIGLNAEEEDLPYFGCVIPIIELTKKIQTKVLQDSKILCIQGVCQNITQDDAGVYCEFKTEAGPSYKIKSKLLIAADGMDSSIRSLLGISTQTQDYEQTALIGNVKMRGLLPHTAFERFTREGPLALLPLDAEHMTVVWVMPTSLAKMRQQCTSSVLCADLQNIMGFRAGQFLEVGTLCAYPLSQVLAEKNHQGRVGLLGNAAHSLHPVAGQGFNLSLRDIFGLYQVLQRYGDALETPALIWKEYERVRSYDQRRTASLTDRLVHLFNSKNKGLQGLRNSLMLQLELCPPAKTLLNEVMVGVT